MLGVYIVGFTLPWIGKRAVLYGAIIGCITMMWIVFKAQSEMALGHMNFEYKPLSVAGCDYNFTMADGTDYDSTTESIISETDHEKHIYQVSYLYYTLIGSMIVVITSIAFSFVFGFEDSSSVDPRLLAPFLRKYIKSTSRKQPLANGRETVIHNFDTKENVCT